MLEGESLINDGTALILSPSRSGPSAALLAPGRAGESRISVGGVAIGLAVGWVITRSAGGSTTCRRGDDLAPERLRGYVPAEELGCSGVLAVVTAGIYIGWQAPEISTASMRLTGYAVWEVLTFLLNALLFVLIGLQLPRSSTRSQGGRGRAAARGRRRLAAVIVRGCCGCT